MRNKVIIHVGYPRTGSTALQYALKKNNNIKLFSRNSNEEVKEFYKFLYQLINSKKNIHNKKKLITKFKKINFNKKINFISEEGILCQEYWMNSNNIYKTLKNFSEILKILKIKYKFIIIIRNQNHLMKSIFNYFYVSYFFKKKIYKLSTLYKNKRYKLIIDSLNYYKLYTFLKKEKINFKFYIYENQYFNKLFNFMNLKSVDYIKRKNSTIFSKYIESMIIKVKFTETYKKKIFIFFYSIILYSFIFLKEIVIKAFFYKRNDLDKSFIKKFYFKSNKKLNKIIELPSDYF